MRICIVLYAFHAYISVICNAPVDSLADHHSAGGGMESLQILRLGCITFINEQWAGAFY